jgi:ribosomal protein S21
VKLVRYAPDTLTPPPAWSRQATCADPAYADHRDELWYALPKERDAVNEAKTICNGCPVRQACLEDAMKAEGGAGHSNRHGIRGGLTPSQRHRLYEELRRRAKAAAAESTADDVPAPAKTGRPPAECGTRSGYQRHVKKGEPIDDACRRANTQATAQLRRTGTTKAAA